MLDNALLQAIHHVIVLARHTHQLLRISDDTPPRILPSSANLRLSRRFLAHHPASRYGGPHAESCHGPTACSMAPSYTRLLMTGDHGLIAHG